MVWLLVGTGGEEFPYRFDPKENLSVNLKPDEEGGGKKKEKENVIEGALKRRFIKQDGA